MAASDLELQAGIFLVAPPVMQDPNFRRAVVLLCDHGSEGSFGLVLNRPIDLSLNEVLEGYFAFDEALCLGGPVQRDTLHFLHRHHDATTEGVALTDGVRWGGDFDVIRDLAQRGAASSDDLRFFLGYAGWSPGQLEMEVDAGGWLLTSSTADLVFSGTPDTLWRTVMQRMGGEYALLANFPDDPRMN